MSGVCSEVVARIAVGVYDSALGHLIALDEAARAVPRGGAAVANELGDAEIQGVIRGHQKLAEYANGEIQVDMSRVGHLKDTARTTASPKYRWVCSDHRDMLLQTKVAKIADS